MASKKTGSDCRLDHESPPDPGFVNAVVSNAVDYS